MPIKRINDFRGAVLDEFKRGSQVGEPTGFPFLDENLKIKPGFFYTVTGWPASGKSEFVMNLALLQAQNTKRKIAFYSPESYPIESFIATMAHCFLGKSTDRIYPSCCSLDEYQAALDWLQEWVFLLSYEDNPDHLTVLEDFKLLKNGHNCKVFILDPFNSLTSDDDNPNMALQLKDVLNKFVLFTHTERVIFFCIEHPKTPRDSNDVTQVPGPYQLFGGSMWWNKSDCVFAVHSIRDTQSGRYTGDVIIKVWKMKNQKLNGIPGEVSAYFDVKTNRYYKSKPEITQKEMFQQRPNKNFYESEKQNGVNDLPF